MTTTTAAKRTPTGQDVIVAIVPALGPVPPIPVARHGVPPSSWDALKRLARRIRTGA